MGKNVIISTLPNISQNYLPKVNTSNIFANSLVYDDGNSVLINTTTASAYKLDVNGTGRFQGALTGTSATFSGSLIVGTGTTGTQYFANASAEISYSATTGLWRFNNLAGGSAPTTYYQFAADGTPIFSILKSGAATFSSNLQVNSYQIINGVAGGTSTYLQFNNNGTAIGYVGSSAAINSGASTSVTLGVASGAGLTIASTGTATFSGPTVTIGSAVAATNVKLILNGVASKAAGIEFHQSGTPQWYIGNGIASEDNNFELYNSNGTMAMKIIKSTNAINFIGAATFSTSVTSTINGVNACSAYGFTSYEGSTPTGKSINFSLAYFNSVDAIYQSSGNTNDFGIWTNGGTATQAKFYIKNGGNVGIGTTDPTQFKLKVVSSGDGVQITSSAGSQALNLLNASANPTILRIANNNGNFYDIQNNVSDNSLTFDYNDSERMRITSGGQLYFSRNTGSVDVINIESYTGHTGRGILINMDTTADAITIGGGGTQNAINVTSSGKKVIISNLGGSGTVTVQADNSGTLIKSSDSSLKEEDKEYKIQGLNEILQLQPRAYKWLKDIEIRKEEAVTEIGFFADEVAPIIPSAAPKGFDGLYGFNDRAVLAAAIKAIQELKAENDQQKADIESLKALINK